MKIDRIIEDHKPRNSIPKSLDGFYSNMDGSDDLFYPNKEANKQRLKDHQTDLRDRGLL